MDIGIARRRFGQQRGDPGERPPFQLRAPDRPVVGAVAVAMMADAAIAITDNDGIGAATRAVFEQTRDLAAISS